MSKTPGIVVHGGAGAYRLVGLANITVSAIEDGVIDAAIAGYKILKAGGSRIDAVIAANVCMEDNPIFNCGRGSYLTVDRTIEMDAMVIDGQAMRTGAVACITNVTNPVKVARAVMDKTAHTMFCGKAATEFAKNQGFDIVPTESLITPKSLASLEKNPVFRVLTTTPVRDPEEHDTVGAVAVDANGHLAVATTTGGITAKMCGRVGDSAIVGAGAYADKTSAVCATGDGEAMVRVCTCKHAAMLMENGTSPTDALTKALDLTLHQGRGSGGCVAMTTKGDVGVVFNTSGMAWASIQGDVIRYGIYPGEEKRRQYAVE